MLLEYKSAKSCVKSTLIYTVKLEFVFLKKTGVFSLMWPRHCCLVRSVLRVSHSKIILCGCLLQICVVQVVLSEVVIESVDAPQKQFNVAVVDSMLKIRQGQAVITKEGQGIYLTTARNAAETGQIVLYSTSSDFDNVTVDVSDLVSGNNRINANDVERYMAHYFEVDHPTDHKGLAGYWPDALVPLINSFALKKHKSQSVWIKIHVGEAVAAGTYVGVLKVRTAGVLVESIPLSVEVWDISLEGTPTLPIIIGLDYLSIKNAELPDGSFQALKKEIIPKYYQSLRKNGVFPVALIDAKPIVYITEDGVEIDFENYETELISAYDGKINAPFFIPLEKSWPVDSDKFPVFSDGYNERVAMYLRKMAAWLSDKGWLDKAFIYIPESDEPGTMSEYEFIVGMQSLANEADSRLRVLQTYTRECVDCWGNGGISALENKNVLWCPNISIFGGHSLKLNKGLFSSSINSEAPAWNEAIASKLKKENRELWFYVNPWTYLLSEPQPNYLNIYIDHQGIKARLLGWFAYANGMTAMTHWNGTYWQDVTHPWGQVSKGESRNQPNGDGVLLYPARGVNEYTKQPKPGGPVLSLRLELMREGAEDYRLLKALEKKLGAGKAQDALSKVYTSALDFTEDPVLLRAVIEQMVSDLHD